MGVGASYASVRRIAADRPWTIVAVGVVGVLLLDILMGLAGGRLAISGVLTKLWDGVVIGLVIGLAAIGLSMTYSILKFANFAHGDYITAGAFAGWGVSFLLAGFEKGNVGFLLLVGAGSGPSSGALGITVLSTPLVVLLGLLVAAVATVALVLVIDRLVYRPMRDHGAISLLIASIGVALALRYLVVFVYDSTTRGLTATTRKVVLGVVDGQFALASSQKALRAAIESGNPGSRVTLVPVLDIGTFSGLLVNVTSHEVALVFASVGLMLGVHLLLQRTKLGTAMRAMADNRSLARISGIPAERVVRATWVIGGGLAGAAGYLIALERGTLVFNLGWILLLLIFAAVILGGIGSIYGAMAGGVIIGITSRISLIWIPSDFATAAAFGVMIVVLLVRPEGLFGGVTTA